MQDRPGKPKRTKQYRQYRLKAIEVSIGAWIQDPKMHQGLANTPQSACTRPCENQAIQLFLHVHESPPTSIYTKHSELYMYTCRKIEPCSPPFKLHIYLLPSLSLSLLALSPLARSNSGSLSLSLSLACLLARGYGGLNPHGPKAYPPEVRVWQVCATPSGGGSDPVPNAKTVTMTNLSGGRRVIRGSPVWTFLDTAQPIITYKLSLARSLSLSDSPSLWLSLSPRLSLSLSGSFAFSFWFSRSLSLALSLAHSLALSRFSLSLSSFSFLVQHSLFFLSFFLQGFGVDHPRVDRFFSPSFVRWGKSAALLPAVFAALSLCMLWASGGPPLLVAPPSAAAAAHAPGVGCCGGPPLLLRAPRRAVWACSPRSCCSCCSCCSSWILEAGREFFWSALMVVPWALHDYSSHHLGPSPAASSSSSGVATSCGSAPGEAAGCLAPPALARS